jgi:hypothetical protein
MMMLFERERSVITKHINNIFSEGELDEESNVHFLHIANSDKPVKIYNLDVIISVGYRVKSYQGTAFRRWATKTLKEYILKGYAINQRFERIEERLATHDKQISFFIDTALPPIEGIFFNGQIFDAYVFVSDLIKSAKKSIVLIDNYIDEVYESTNSHDRFLIIDDQVYHIGASLKDLGKKLFGFSKMEIAAKLLSQDS